MFYFHRRQIDYLQKIIDAGGSPRGFVFFGPEGVGKRKIAEAFVAAFQKSGKITSKEAFGKENHPDILIIEKEKDKKEISIEQIRDLKKYMSFSPYQEKFKAAIIADAHFLSVAAQNALLKTLEEPKGESLVILTALSKNLLLDTVNSRLQPVEFNLAGPKEIFIFLKEQKVFFNRTDEEIKSAALYCFGRPEYAVNLLKNDQLLKSRRKFHEDLHNLLEYSIVRRYQYVEKMVKSKEWDDEKKEFLNGLIFALREVLLVKNNLIFEDGINSEIFQRKIAAYAAKKNIFEITKAADLALKISFLIEHSNVNNRLALERMMLEL